MIVAGKVTTLAPLLTVTKVSKVPVVGSLGMNVGVSSPGDLGKYCPVKELNERCVEKLFPSNPGFIKAELPGAPPKAYMMNRCESVRAFGLDLQKK